LGHQLDAAAAVQCDEAKLDNLSFEVDHTSDIIPAVAKMNAVISV